MRSALESFMSRRSVSCGIYSRYHFSRIQRNLKGVFRNKIFIFLGNLKSLNKYNDIRSKSEQKYL